MRIMTPRLARGLLVVAAFTLVTTVTLTEQYLSTQGMSLPPRPGALSKPLPVLYWSSFKYFLAWALVAPGVFWLSRVVPLTQRRWLRPALFHLVMPLIASIPFFTFRLLLSSALALTWPPFHVIESAWWKILTMESIAIAPTYWVLVGAGAIHVFSREDRARQVRTLDLQRALVTAQLDGLRMKLQPDFLFNTLNTIGALAQEGDTEGVGQLVDHLGTLLRLSMEASGRQFVTLDEELRLLDAYLAIEGVRHKDRLSVVRRIEHDAGDVLVPNLILQPLVQNAIAHGLGGRIEATTVEVAARRDGADLELAVRDNGPGLPAGWTAQQGAGRGLANVRERLAALYGDAGRLQMSGHPDGGVQAVLRLPLTPPHTSENGDLAWTA